MFAAIVMPLVTQSATHVGMCEFDPELPASSQPVGKLNGSRN